MRIVIITDALTAPLYTPRVRFLNRQLRAEGHSVVWFAEASPQIPADIRPDNLVEIPYYRRHDHGIKGILSLLFDHKNRYFARHIRPDFTPDLIFCSTFMTFGLRAGVALSSRYGCPLAVDLRDIAEQTPTNAYSQSALRSSGLYRAVNIRRRNRALRRADCITTVSRFHASVIGAINPHTHIIYNGYDAEMFRPEHHTPGAIRRVIYTGRWYGTDMQDPRPILRAIAGVDDVRLTFYTDPACHEQLMELARSCGADRAVAMHDYVPNGRVPELLHQADCALILTSPHNHGVLTTKFFEALGCHTPVLCCPSDHGELAALIADTHAGLATDDPAEMLSFVRTSGHSAPVGAEQYSRQTQTGRLIRLLCSLC